MKSPCRFFALAAFASSCARPDVSPLSLAAPGGCSAQTAAIESSFRRAAFAQMGAAVDHDALDLITDFERLCSSVGRAAGVRVQTVAEQTRQRLKCCVAPV